MFGSHDPCRCVGRIILVAAVAAGDRVAIGDGRMAASESSRGVMVPSMAACGQRDRDLDDILIAEGIVTVLNYEEEPGPGHFKVGPPLRARFKFALRGACCTTVQAQTDQKRWCSEAETNLNTSTPLVVLCSFEMEFWV